MAENNEKQESVEESSAVDEEQSIQQDQAVSISKDARMWAMFCHLAGLAGFVLPAIGCVIGPLVVWQIKKEEFPFVDEQGKEAVNFQISMFLYSVIGSVACAITCIGIPLIPFIVGIIGICDLVFLLIAAVKANNGEHYRYPLIIRFVK